MAEGTRLPSNLLWSSSHCFHLPRRRFERSSGSITTGGETSEQRSRQLLAEQDGAVWRGPLHLEHVLCQVVADDGNLSHGYPLLQFLFSHHEYGTSRCRRGRPASTPSPPSNPADYRPNLAHLADCWISRPLSAPIVRRLGRQHAAMGCLVQTIMTTLCPQRPTGPLSGEQTSEKAPLTLFPV